MTFPILSLIVFIPIISAVAILFMDSESKMTIRTVALVTGFAVLGLAAASYFGYLNGVSEMEATLTASSRRPNPATPRRCSPSS